MQCTCSCSLVITNHIHEAKNAFLEDKSSYLFKWKLSKESLSPSCFNFNFETMMLEENNGSVFELRRRPAVPAHLPPIARTFD